MGLCQSAGRGERLIWYGQRQAERGSTTGSGGLAPLLSKDKYVPEMMTTTRIRP